MIATVPHFFSDQAARRRPVTWSRIRKLYDAPESFTDLLPWAEYLPEDQAFALADGRSVGAFFEIRPSATDGQSTEYLGSLCARLQDLITDAVPEEDPDPWVLQIYVQDDPSLEAVLGGIRDEVDPALLGSLFTAHPLP
ncbi:MAG: TraC family protein [Gammaproteobacteria bacterium]